MAAHLIRQAYPVADVFDNLLMMHIVPQLRRRRPPAVLKLWAFNMSLFAQIAKVTPKLILPTALRSYERTIGESPRFAAPSSTPRDGVGNSRRKRGKLRSLYKPARRPPSRWHGRDA